MRAGDSPSPSACPRKGHRGGIWKGHGGNFSSDLSGAAPTSPFSLSRVPALSPPLWLRLSSGRLGSAGKGAGGECEGRDQGAGGRAQMAVTCSNLFARGGGGAWNERQGSQGDPGLALAAAQSPSLRARLESGPFSWRSWPVAAGRGGRCWPPLRSTGHSCSARGGGRRGRGTRSPGDAASCKSWGAGEAV